MDTRRQEVIVSSAYQNLPTYGYHVLQRFTKETFGSFLFSSVRIDWEQHVPDPSNDSLYLIKPFSSSSPEGICGGNQQNPSITNDLHDLPQWFHVFCYISYKDIYIYTHVIVNRQGHHNIRNGTVWAQTGHSTGTCTATLCVIEL